MKMVFEMKSLNAIFTISGNLTAQEHQALTRAILLLNQHFELDLKIVPNCKDLTAEDWHKQIINELQLKINGKRTV